MSGLYKVVTQTRSGLLVESITDGKRFPVYSTTRVSALSDISIYGKQDDIALKDVLAAIFKKLDGKQKKRKKRLMASLVIGTTITARAPLLSL